MTYYSDGFTYGANPSKRGGGFTICDETGKVLLQKEYLRYFTNNEGELLGVLHAAMLASNLDEIITDSQNTMAWVRSGNPKARPDLKEPAETAKRLIAMKRLKLTWQPREKNLAGIHNEKELPLLQMFL